MAGLANRARRDWSHEVGEKVWLATKNLPLRAGTRKLSAIWAGPFEVIEAIGPVAYRLRLPEDWGVHDVFHISQLKLRATFSMSRQCRLTKVRSLR